jgi:hypothetical protein
MSSHKNPRYQCAKVQHPAKKFKPNQNKREKGEKYNEGKSKSMHSRRSTPISTHNNVPLTRITSSSPPTMNTLTLQFSNLTASRNITTIHISTNDPAFFVSITLELTFQPFRYLRPQLLQMIPPNVRRQQVVFVHLQERQLLPTIDAGISIDMVVVLEVCTG